MMKNKQKLLAIIPAFNEEGSVGKVVEDVKKYLPQADALVVNDGSTNLASEKAKAVKLLKLSALKNYHTLS
ncbi:MAG: glycosyltransferase [Deltaproteobacteria bacterium]|nr:glycosyltransferase [Deltaproteobacteria bacterium]